VTGRVHDASKVLRRLWRAKGEPIFAPRGNIHTYRNTGSISGKLCVFISPAGFEDYLEELSPYSPATDMPKILEISGRHGISFYL
jgi:hypothetical protein